MPERTLSTQPPEPNRKGLPDKQEELQLFAEGGSEPLSEPEAVSDDTADIPVVGEVGSARSRKAAIGPENGLLRRILDSLQWTITPPVARVVITGQLVLIFGLAIMVAIGREAPDTAATDTIAGSQTPASGELSLTFAPGATEADIRALLLDHQLRLVSGPSALGLYQAAAASGSDLDQILAGLESSQIVLFAQAMPTP